VLNWHPQFAEISASEDFGYTTGPWTYQNSLADTVIARGQYSTVWHLDKNGHWKFLVDFGIDNTSRVVQKKGYSIRQNIHRTQILFLI
jgi:hypothetical protein